MLYADIFKERVDQVLIPNDLKPFHILHSKAETSTISNAINDKYFSSRLNHATKQRISSIESLIGICRMRQIQMAVTTPSSEVRNSCFSSTRASKAPDSLRKPAQTYIVSEQYR